MGMFSVGLGLSDFIFKELEKFEEHLSKKNRKRLANFIAHTVYLFSIAGPIMTLPQILHLYGGKDAAGLSIITWSSYLFFSFFWVTYGVFIKNKPIVFANFLWIIMNSLVIFGIYLYG